MKRTTDVEMDKLVRTATRALMVNILKMAREIDSGNVSLSKCAALGKECKENERLITAESLQTVSRELLHEIALEHFAATMSEVAAEQMVSATLRTVKNDSTLTDEIQRVIDQLDRAQLEK